MPANGRRVLIRRLKFKYLPSQVKEEFEIPYDEIASVYKKKKCPRTGPWHQLYRAARRSPGICHFSFLSIFHE